MTGTADRSSERRDGMREGRGGVGKRGASLELTAGKEQRNLVSQCNAGVHCATITLHYLGLISATFVAPLACNTTHARK